MPRSSNKTNPKLFARQIEIQRFNARYSQQFLNNQCNKISSSSSITALQIQTFIIPNTEAYSSAGSVVAARNYFPAAAAQMGKKPRPLPVPILLPAPALLNLPSLDALAVHTAAHKAVRVQQMHS